jgi:hypothetical protein
VNIHDPAWPEQRATIHRTLDAARTRDAMGLFTNGWLLSIEHRHAAMLTTAAGPQLPTKPCEDQRQ